MLFNCNNKSQQPPPAAETSCLSRNTIWQFCTLSGYIRVFLTPEERQYPSNTWEWYNFPRTKALSFCLLPEMYCVLPPLSWPKLKAKGCLCADNVINSKKCCRWAKQKQTSHMNNRKHAGRFLLVVGFLFFFPTKLFRTTFPIMQEQGLCFIIHPIDPAPKEKTQAPSVHTHTLFMANVTSYRHHWGLTHIKYYLIFSSSVIVPWNQQLLHRWAPGKEGRLQSKHQLADSCRFVGLITMTHAEASRSSEPPMAFCERAAMQKQNVS